MYSGKGNGDEDKIKFRNGETRETLPSGGKESSRNILKKRSEVCTRLSYHRMNHGPLWSH